jgi:hypothetical protein
MEVEVDVRGTGCGFGGRSVGMRACRTREMDADVLSLHVTNRRNSAA